MLHKFPYKGFPSIELPDGSIAGIYKPAEYSQDDNESKIFEKALVNTIGSEPLDRIVQAGMKIVIVVDDITRSTKTELMLPPVLKWLKGAKIGNEDISIFVALGTHRQMTEQEIRLKYTDEAAENHRIINPDWKKGEDYETIEKSDDGFEIKVHKEILKADFVIGLGQAVPHMYAGFGGGGKIINPGCCEEQTIGQMHWLGHTVPTEKRFGVRENKVRALIDDVAIKCGLKFILNEVPNQDGTIAKAFAGDPIKAHSQACRFAAELYCVKVKQGDIVIADSYPADIDLWQSIKAMYSAHFAVKKGGTLIFVTPSPEKISSQHPEIIDIGYKCGFEQIEKLVGAGRLSKVVAANVWAGNEITQHCQVIIVSGGISKKETQTIGFDWAASPQHALAEAMKRHGKDAKINVLCGASKIICQVQS
ncbi:MAG: nickel-dependent lactate racemase [Sedimentisphaerales bacterium]